MVSMMNDLIKKYVFLILINKIICETIIHKKPIVKPLVPSEIYTHYEYVNDDDKDQYKIFWKILSDRQIQFEVHCRTTGWVGLGISLNGGMKGADIAIGWVDSHGPHLKDCHSPHEGLEPIVDHEQNWLLMDGAEIDGYTILKIKRSLFTCDIENDREIKNGITYLIFAWNDRDPHCEDWTYHGPNRFSKSLLLLNYKRENFTGEILPPGTIKYDLTVKNIPIPEQKSYYYCELIELPKLKDNMHLIKFEMIIQKENSNNVHYLLGFECDDDYIPSKLTGDECDSIPNDVKIKCKSKIFASWSYGSNNFLNEAGYKLIKANQTKYIMLEIYYKNHNLLRGKRDNSGLRLYMTPTLRPNDIGILSVTTDRSPISLQIPGNSKEFHHEVICYPQCTEKYLPKNGIYLFSGLLYTHLAGVSVKLSLIRDGKLIANLFENDNYDSKYQHLVDIEPFKLNKGDSFLLECEYNTEDRSNFTLNGFSRTTDETCSAFLYYYPKVNEFDFCESTFSYESIFDFYHELMSQNLMPKIELGEDSVSLNRIETIIKYQMQSTPKVAEEFENFFRSHYAKMAECGTPALNKSYVREIPHYSAIENLIEKIYCDFDSYPHEKCLASKLNIKTNLILVLFSFSFINSFFLIFKT